MEDWKGGKCQEEKARKTHDDAFSFYFADLAKYCTVILVIANAEISKGRPATANLPCIFQRRCFLLGFQIPQLIRLFGGPLRWFRVNLHAIIPLAIRFRLHLLPLVLDLLLLSLQVPSLLHRKLPAEYP
jgi:hypothetical protein